jgi:hypothetical protein
MKNPNEIEDAPPNPFYTAYQPVRWLRRRDFLELSALSFGCSITRPAKAGPAEKDNGREKDPGMGQGTGGKKRGKLAKIEITGCQIAFLSLKKFPSCWVVRQIIPSRPAFLLQSLWRAFWRSAKTGANTHER